MKRLLTTTATAAAALAAAALAVQSVGAATAPLPPLHANAGEAAEPRNGRTGPATTRSSTAGAAGSSARPAGSSGGNHNNHNKNRGGWRPPMMTAEHDGGPDRYIPKGAFPPSSSGLWTTVSDPTDSDRVEFLPASSLLAHHEDLGTAETHLPPNLHRQLTRYNLQNAYSVQPFVNGDMEYDEYQQAWRYLGFVIDCDSNNDDDSSWDGGTGEGCLRFLIWAAYVDVNYEGGGIGEYQYWDRTDEAWDTTPCKYAENGVTRCAKMDCHLDDTHFSLLGFFKHSGYDDWMEQLFKHEGFCVWSTEEYAFMKKARKTWPQGCDYAGEASDGTTLYYDLKPESNGYFTAGLYTDTKCTENYSGETQVEDIIGNFLLGGSGGSADYGYDFNSMYSTLDESLAAWHSAFDAWRICQPCLAHDLENVGYGYDDDSMKGPNYGKYWYGNDDYYNDDQVNDNGVNFDCYDAADYTNVNQCMKFMAKTAMQSATFSTLSLASAQGTLSEYVTREGYTAKRNTKKAPSRGGTGIFFTFSFLLSSYGAFMFYKARKEAKNMPKYLEQPLSGVFT